MASEAAPFWETKSLSELTHQEWEALCDGCGHCCLIKLEDERSGELYVTQVACYQLDLETCRCRDYPNRLQIVDTCMGLSAEDPRPYRLLPETCAYRCVAEQRPLPDWHPLRTGDPAGARQAGVAVCAFALSEQAVHESELEDLILERIGGPESG